MVRVAISRLPPSQFMAAFKRKRGYKKRRARKRRRVGACAVQEKKFHDFVYSSDAISADWAELSHGGGNSLLLIAQGLTESTRVGRRICVHNINLSGEVTMASSVDVAHGRNLVRVCLVQDRQCNGVAPAMLDIFEVVTDGIHSYRNLANAARFNILWSKTVVLNAEISGDGTNIDTNAMSVPFSCVVKCEIPIEYDSTAGALTELQSNNLFVVGVTGHAVPAVVFNTRGRIRFTD